MGGANISGGAASCRAEALMSVVLGLVLDVGHRDLYLDAQALAWQYMPERNRSVQ